MAELINIPASRLEETASLLAEYLSDYPLIYKVVSDPDRRHLILKFFFTDELLRLYKDDEFFTSDPDLSCIIICCKVYEIASKDTRSMLSKHMRSALYFNEKRIIDAVVNNLHSFIGSLDVPVDTEFFYFMGSKNGVADMPILEDMIKKILNRNDNSGRSTVLFTAKQDRMALYKSFGFEDLKSIVDAKKGFEVKVMIHRPAKD